MNRDLPVTRTTRDGVLLLLALLALLAFAVAGCDQVGASPVAIESNQEARTGQHMMQE